ncbi:hypothetical protein A2Z56_02475 [Candidatus Kaiserbacteria bacterium RIFCSPHIGHO2_12_45_16]|nr:MAG: hypothetical protein A2Z56_02475 [Candidatus Kaiserbacteria bacterium RIFCSPHIGHO2_12_45_16]
MKPNEVKMVCTYCPNIVVRSAQTRTATCFDCKRRMQKMRRVQKIKDKTHEIPTHKFQEGTQEAQKEAT